jgi:crotonobetainyl-CoA:carnitine CoA-transferase CaiB-like acyl-CoA transferase
MLQRSSSQWQQLLDEAGIPCAPVQNTEQLLDHPQMAAMGLLQSIPDANYQTIGLPLRLNGERPKSRSPAPALGEANAQWQRMTDSILRAGQHTSEALTEPSQFNIADYASNHRKTTP